MVKKDNRNSPPVNIKDVGYNTISFHPTDGEPNPIDISNGYVPKSSVARRTGFWICPLVSGVIVVRLLNQVNDDVSSYRSFTIAQVRVDANIGQYLEEKCIEIIANGTTVSSAIIAWNE